MQVSNPNDINIYNLSAGKSLPEWLSDRKKRSLQKNDIDVRRRITLIQDFEMPSFSSCIHVSGDGQYILATGVYKPRVRCYDVNQLSLKFERCLDYEVIRFKILSEDYSKLVFLESDRFVEFHNQFGHYYKTRLPKFGRDMAYHSPNCDMYFVGASSEIYRLNLEQGRFMNPFVTDASEINVCDINPVHHLFACGTVEGNIECWDPRSRHRVGLLDCALSSISEDVEINGIPAISCLKYKDGLYMAIGTSTGQVLLYDIRSDKPVLVKDHQYGLPIIDVEFSESMDLILSMDTKVLKIWDRNTAKPYTAIESNKDLNDLCLVPNSGLLFMACEDPKILTYFLPSLGPAPKWCSFLDNLTEELEENPQPVVYDDYKFVTKKDLEELGLSHLLGTKMLRAYMHGFFMDIQLYHKAKAIAEPFAYEDYKKKKIREKIDDDRKNRVQIKKLPKVNRDLAEKLMLQEEDGDSSLMTKKKNKNVSNLLHDDRFKALFENPDFQIDKESEAFRLLNPVVSGLEKKKQKKKDQLAEQIQEDEDEVPSPDNISDSSSDDDHTWTREVKRQHKMLKRENKQKARELDRRAVMTPKAYELKEGEQLKSMLQKNKKESKSSLGERVEKATSGFIKESTISFGNKEVVFNLENPDTDNRRKQEAQQHHEERRKIRRSAHNIEQEFKKKDQRFWMRK